MTKEEFAEINKILMVMGRSERSKTWFVRHSYSMDILDKMLELEYLTCFEKNKEIYYQPTEKSREIW